MFRSPHGDLQAAIPHTRSTIPKPAPRTEPVVGRTPFPGNIIPASRIDPISAKILAFLPATNQPFLATTQTNDYYALLPFRKTNDQVDSKIDYTLSDKDRISGRFSFARPVIFQAPIFGTAGGPAQGAFAGSGTQKTYSTGLNWNHVFGPTLLAQVRIGVAHYHNAATQSDYGQEWDRRMVSPA